MGFTVPEKTDDEKSKENEEGEVHEAEADDEEDGEMNEIFRGKKWLIDLSAFLA